MLSPQQCKQALYDELLNILHYWMNFAPDEINGGFFGKIDNENQVQHTAPKGSVLNARILWTFAAAYNLTKEKKYLSIASRAFDYIRNHFIDKEFGGVYWTVDYEGNRLDSKKQIYALAFSIYGLSEYYAATNNDDALLCALRLYDDIEMNSYDAKHGGYFEAFTREWKEADDLRLSTKDANEKKTMNTHLHIIEAYSGLYKVYPSAQIKGKITELLDLFDNHFIDHSSWHLKLFFDEIWNEKPDVISYGHDIEAAWLLLQCAEIIQDDEWIGKYKQYAVKIAEAASEGLDKDGGLWYEYDPFHHILIKEKHWWPQAEAIVGFINAWQISGDDKYYHIAVRSWQFIDSYLLNKQYGEWFWGVKEDDTIMQNEDKAGLWKCPYHNGRACIEVIKRVEAIISFDQPSIHAN